MFLRCAGCDALEIYFVPLPEGVVDFPRAKKLLNLVIESGLSSPVEVSLDQLICACEGI